jgi:YgiT-type zinc finger domain-containing protein
MQDDAREVRKLCPVCGGALYSGEATIPYILNGDIIVVVKHVPAEICSNCGEAFTIGSVTDRITAMLRQLKSLHSEVSVVSYSQVELV